MLAGEEVDLPILFFIDRDFVDDPTMRDVQDVVLSYTFLCVASFRRCIPAPKG